MESGKEKEECGDREEVTVRSRLGLEHQRSCSCCLKRVGLYSFTLILIVPTP